MAHLELVYWKKSPTRVHGGVRIHLKETCIYSRIISTLSFSLRSSIPVPALRDSAYLTAVHPVAAPPLSVVSDEALRMTSCPSEDRDIRRRQLSQLRVILRVPDELNFKEIFYLVNFIDGLD